MGNRFLPPRSLRCFLDVSLRRGSLFFSCHSFCPRRSFCEPPSRLHLSGDPFVCALLSSLPLSATVQSVVPSRALRVSTTLVWTPNDGFPVSALVSLPGSASQKVSCGGRSGPLSDHAWPDVSFVARRVLEAAILLPPAALSRDQLRSPAPAIGRRVRLRECVPFLRAQTRQPEYWEICLRARPRARVQLLLLLA